MWSKLKNIKQDIEYRISNIGKLPICNLKPERAPKINNFVFLFCYRCTGIIFGGICSTILYYLNIKKFSVILFILFSLPIFIDVIIQKYNIMESTNVRRFITGFLFGVGLIFIAK